MKLVLTEFWFMDCSRYKEWIHTNTEDWKWSYKSIEFPSMNYSKPTEQYISGVYLNEIDTVAFRLKFGL